MSGPDDPVLLLAGDLTRHGAGRAYAVYDL